MLVARRLLAFALLGSLVVPAHAENELSRLHKVAVSPADDEVVVRISGSRAPDFTSFTMQNPFRVVVDWAGSALDGVSDRQDYGRGVVRRIETQQFESEAERISRVTITLAQPVQFRFESAGKDVVVRFERVGDMPNAPDAEPVAAAAVPEPEDEPPPPDDPVLAELKKLPMPEGPLFEPAEPPPAPKPPPVVAVAPVAPPVVAAAPTAPPAKAAPTTAVAAATPPVAPAPPATVVASAAPPPPPALSPSPSRPVAEPPVPATLASAAQLPPPTPVTDRAPAPSASPGAGAPLARFEPPAAAKPSPTPPPEPEKQTLARFTPPAPAPEVKPTPAPVPTAPSTPVAARAPEPTAPVAPAPVAVAPPSTTGPRASAAAPLPPLPVARAEPRVARAERPTEARAPRPSYHRFGEGFEVIQTGRGMRAGSSEVREIEPFEISRAPSRAPKVAADPRSAPAPAYSASRPSFYAQSAGSGAAKEVIESGDDFEAGSREMRMIGFQQKPDKSAVYVRCDAKAKFKVERVSDTRVVLKLFDTRVPLENNKRPLDTSFFEGSVTGVKATELGADTLVEVDLRGPVPFEVKRIGSYVYLYFSKS